MCRPHAIDATYEGHCIKTKIVVLVVLLLGLALEVVGVVVFGSLRRLAPEAEVAEEPRTGSFRGRIIIFISSQVGHDRLSATFGRVGLVVLVFVHGRDGPVVGQLVRLGLLRLLRLLAHRRDGRGVVVELAGLARRGVARRGGGHASLARERLLLGEGGHRSVRSAVAARRGWSRCGFFGLRANFFVVLGPCWRAGEDIYGPARRRRADLWLPCFMAVARR
jgi:hypothetical protein